MNALVPHRRSELRRGAASVLQFASDDVVADVRVERVDKRNRCSWYALKLASNRGDLIGRLLGVRAGGRLDELGVVQVTSGSITTTRFAVTTPQSGAYRAMYLELCSGEMMMRVEAPRPPAPRPLRPLKTGATLLGIGVVLGCAGLAPRAFDGIRFARVPAAAPTPVSARPHAPAAIAPNVARIVSFTARRDPVPGGESILASYLAVADTGTIELFDPAGKRIAFAPFAHVGTNRLAVPQLYGTVPLTARITAHRGATKAVASVAVPPNALAPASPSPTPSAEPLDAALAVPGEGVTPLGGDASGNDGIVSVVGRAVAGEPLRLRVTAQANPMRAELEDESGAVIAEVAIPAGATQAALPLPASDERATYLIALHYTRDGGEETVIRTVLAAPAPAAHAQPAPKP